MKEMTKKVEIILEIKHKKANQSSVQEKCTKGLISESSILNAVTQVLYHQRHMVVTTTVNADTLNIVKVVTCKLLKFCSKTKSETLNMITLSFSGIRK